jgi:ribosome biogenesis GTPase A
MSGFWPVVEAVIRKSDIIVLVFDARIPELSSNELLEKKVKRLYKPLIYVANKMDLVNEKELESMKKLYPEWFFVSGTKNIGISNLRRALQIMGKRMKLENPSVGIVGYPNVGKSAVINAISHRAKTVVSPIAGTTRGHQLVRAGSLWIVDSPGVIPYEEGEWSLGMIGAKNPEKMRNKEKVAMGIIRRVKEIAPEVLEERYKIKLNELEDDYEILLEIGRKRGFLKKGGEVDEAKTSIVIMQEWQTGKLRL